MNNLMSYQLQSGLEINNCTRRLGNVSASFMENSYFPAFIPYIYHILLLQQDTIKKIGLSKSSVSVLSLTVLCIYTRLQMHVSVPGGVGIYIHIGVQVDTDNLVTYHFFNLTFLP